MAVSRAVVARLPARNCLPLCVDLNGSLLVTNSLHEAFLGVLTRRPLDALAAVPRLGRGKAAFNRRLAELAPLDPAFLPYNEPLLAYLRGQKMRGRELTLISGADQSIVRAVADHIGIFDHAICSDGRTDRSGVRKLEAIRERHRDGFAYVGRAENDPAIWREASAAVVIGECPEHSATVQPVGPIEACFPAPMGGAAAWCRELRLHQWAKNLWFLCRSLLAGSVSTFANCLGAQVGVSRHRPRCLRRLPGQRPARPRRRPGAPGQAARPLAAGEHPTERRGSGSCCCCCSPPPGRARSSASLFGLTALAAYLATTLAIPWAEALPALDVFLLGSLYACASWPAWPSCRCRSRPGSSASPCCSSSAWRWPSATPRRPSRRHR